MNTDRQKAYIEEYAKLTQKFIDNTPDELKQNYSDGYHSFKELYNIRLAYNVALFNQWAKDYNEVLNSYKGIDPRTLHPEILNHIKNSKPKYDVHKSWKHHDGELCFGGGWFIVVAVLPTGQISNHYEAKYWDLFKIPETEKALFEFDGHTTTDCIDRLLKL